MSARHGLDKHLRNRAKVTALRRPVTERGPGVVALAQLEAVSAPGQSFDHVPGASTSALRPTAPGPALTAARPAVFAAPVLDDRGRIQVTALARELGWTAGQHVGGVVDPDAGLVTLGEVLTPSPQLTVRARLDSNGRLSLNPALRAALGVGPGAQVVAAGDPAAGWVVLRSAGAALSALDPNDLAGVPDRLAEPPTTHPTDPMEMSS